jgi:hypothetical protein
MEQIESSLNILLSDLSKLKVTVVNVRIVTTKNYPNFKQDREYIKLNKQIVKTGGTLMSQNSLLEETV